MNRRLFVGVLFFVSFFLLVAFSSGTVQWLIQLFTLGVLTGLSVIVVMSLMQNKTPMITRYALLMGAEDSPEERSYTRKVTWVWALFFIALLILKSEALLSDQLATSLGFVELVFYAGSGVLFVGEFYIRQWFLPAHRGSSLWSFLHQLSQVSPKEVWEFDAKGEP